MKTKTSRAVALAIAGTALTAGAVSSASAANMTMYNTFTTASGGDLGHNLKTDGWTRTTDGPHPNNVPPFNRPPDYVYGDGIPTGPESRGNYGDLVPWVGTAGGGLPFSYTGSAVLHWAADLENSGLLEISRADAYKNYTFEAEIDTGAGAWMDEASNPDTGWKHQTDIGLIRNSSGGDLTITLNLARVEGTPSAPGLINDNFGITIFEGKDATTANYSHHGAWNCPDCTPNAMPFDKSNPWYATGVGSGMTYLIHNENVDTINGLTFTAKAGQIYTVALGGAGVGQWAQNVSDYALTIKAVPEPASLSLFGIALAGMAATRRRKSNLAT